MEVIGLTISVASLVTLYNTLVDISSKLDSFAKYNSQRYPLLAQIGADSVLLRGWAFEVGITNGQLQRNHHPALDRAEVRTIIMDIFRNLNKIFGRILDSKRPFDQNTSANIAPPLDSNLYVADSPQGAISEEHTEGKTKRRHRLKWAFGGQKAEWEEHVFRSSALIDKLFLLIPVNLYARRKDFRDWLEIHSTEDTYSKRLAERVQGTCRWLQELQSFRSWYDLDDEDLNSRLLWIHGPAGFGKSVNCAFLISTLEIEDHVFHFFCSGDGDGQKQPMAIVRTWIWQMAQSDESIMLSLLERRSSYQPGQTTDETIWELFQLAAVQLSCPIFVIDGFDECDRNSPNWRDGTLSIRTDFLRQLLQHLKGANMRLIIFSRDEIDIRDGIFGRESEGWMIFEHVTRQSDVKQDLEVYSSFVIQDRLSKRDSGTKHTLAKRLAERADGMFLWIKLQQGALHPTKTNGQLLSIINGMPRGLQHVVDRDLDYISRLSDHDRTRAMNLLRWITFSTRALTVLELSEALAINSDAECFEIDIDSLPECIDEEYVQNEIKGICGSLISVQTSSEEPYGAALVKPFHFAVKIFLLPRFAGITDEKAITRAEANKLGCMCVQYLCLDYSWSREPHLPAWVETRPFLKYAVMNWAEQIDKESSTAMIHIFQLFSPTNPFWPNWRDMFEENSRIQDEKQTKKHYIIPGEREYYAASFGLVGILVRLQGEQNFDINRYGGELGYPLQAACFYGHEKAVDFLVENGASINALGGVCGCALNAAVSNGHETVVAKLIAKNANVNITSERWYNAALYAAGHGYLNILEQLFQAGCDIEKVSLNGWTPITRAAEQGHLGTIKFLISKGADINMANEAGDTALDLATSSGHFEIVNFLLESGADYEHRTLDGFTPIHSASRSGHCSIVNLFLSKGVDIDLQMDDETTPLWQAVRYGHLETVDFLLQKGANVNPSLANGWSPLHISSREGYLEITRNLVDHGAKLEYLCEDACTPLYIATDHGHSEIIKLLLDKGANIETPSDNGTTPLTRAAALGDYKIVRLLVEKGALIDTPDNDGWTPLCGAAALGFLEIVSFLLEKGANLNTQFSGGWTPLNSAANDGHLEIVKLLLERGADCNIPAEGDWMPLTIATVSGHFEIVKLLIESGANIEFPVTKGWRPLQFAAHSGSAKIVKLLLESGADINASHKNGRTALHYAASEGHHETVQLLLEKGATTSSVALDGNSPLMRAILRGHLDSARLLVEQTKSLRDRFGRTFLHAALSKAFVSSLAMNVDQETLLQCMLPDRLGRTLLHHAATSTTPDYLEWVLEQGIYVNTPDNHSWTPLHWAAYFGRTETLVPLKKAGADLEARDWRGWQPHTLAAFMGNDEFSRDARPHGIRETEVHSTASVAEVTDDDAYCDCCGRV